MFAEWHLANKFYPTPSRSATFTSLPQQHCTMRLPAARNGDGGSIAEASAANALPPYLHPTTCFDALFVLTKDKYRIAATSDQSADITLETEL